MELKRLTYMTSFGKRIAMLLLALAISFHALAQKTPVYAFRNGKMYIELEKNISAQVLNKFIEQFNLNELDLNNFIRTGNPDSLHMLGWQVELDSLNMIRLIKTFEAFGHDLNSANRIVFNNTEPIFPSTGNGLVYGINRFRKKQPFAVRDGEVTFYLRDFQKAERVMLAGSFNNWSPSALAMQRTDSGWIANVKLTPGKWWYKFIVDDHWITDPDNLNKENDGVGNLNSIYFLPNIVFTTNAFPDAKQVFVAGSFNNWDERQLPMIKKGKTWSLPLYLADGTHRYKFFADGKWYSDEANKEKLPDGVGGVNSVMIIGKPQTFQLTGYTTAAKVFVAGSFNGWKENELEMTRTATGWELPYVLGPGTYEFKFLVDGKWIGERTPENEFRNFLLVVQPNHTFKLDGYASAKTVYVTGEFNGWNPTGYPMKKQGDQWVLPLQLPVGKHRYKFIVDGEWILDPANKLWEENEYHTGNSVLWIEN